MYAKHPELAREFESKTPKGTKLPDRVAKAPTKAAANFSPRLPRPAAPGPIGTIQPPRSPLSGAASPSQAAGLATTSAPTSQGPTIAPAPPPVSYNAATSNAGIASKTAAHDPALSAALDRFSAAWGRPKVAMHAPGLSAFNPAVPTMPQQRPAAAMGQPAPAAAARPNAMTSATAVPPAAAAPMARPAGAASGTPAPPSPSPARPPAGVLASNSQHMTGSAPTPASKGMVPGFKNKGAIAGTPNPLGASVLAHGGALGQGLGKSTGVKSSAAGTGVTNRHDEGHLSRIAAAIHADPDTQDFWGVDAGEHVTQVMAKVRKHQGWHHIYAHLDPQWAGPSAYDESQPVKSAAGTTSTGYGGYGAVADRLGQADFANRNSQPTDYRGQGGAGGGFTAPPPLKPHYRQLGGTPSARTQQVNAAALAVRKQQMADGAPRLAAKFKANNNPAAAAAMQAISPPVGGSDSMHPTVADNRATSPTKAGPGKLISTGQLDQQAAMRKQPLPARSSDPGASANQVQLDSEKRRDALLAEGSLKRTLPGAPIGSSSAGMPMPTPQPRPSIASASPAPSMLRPGYDVGAAAPRPTSPPTAMAARPRPSVPSATIPAAQGAPPSPATPPPATAAASSPVPPAQPPPAVPRPAQAANPLPMATPPTLGSAVRPPTSPIGAPQPSASTLGQPGTRFGMPIPVLGKKAGNVSGMLQQFFGGGAGSIAGRVLPPPPRPPIATAPMPAPAAPRPAVATPPAMPMARPQTMAAPRPAAATPATPRVATAGPIKASGVISNALSNALANAPGGAMSSSTDSSPSPTGLTQATGVGVATGQGGSSSPLGQPAGNPEPEPGEKSAVIRNLSKRAGADDGWGGWSSGPQVDDLATPPQQEGGDPPGGLGGFGDVLHRSEKGFKVRPPHLHRGDSLARPPRGPHLHRSESLSRPPRNPRASWTSLRASDATKVANAPSLAGVDPQTAARVARWGLPIIGLAETAADTAGQAINNPDHPGVSAGRALVTGLGTVGGLTAGQHFGEKLGGPWGGIGGAALGAIGGGIGGSLVGSRLIRGEPEKEKEAAVGSSLFAGLARKARMAASPSAIGQTIGGAAAGAGAGLAEVHSGVADPNMSGEGKATLVGLNAAAGGLFANPMARRSLFMKRTLNAAPTGGLAPKWTRGTAMKPLAIAGAAGGVAALPKAVNLGDASAKFGRKAQEAMNDPATAAAIANPTGFVAGQADKLIKSQPVKDGVNAFGSSLGKGLAGMAGGGIAGNLAGRGLGALVAPDDETLPYKDRRNRERMRGLARLLGTGLGSAGGMYAMHKFAMNDWYANGGKDAPVADNRAAPRKRPDRKTYAGREVKLVHGPQSHANGQFSAHGIGGRKKVGEVDPARFAVQRQQAAELAIDGGGAGDALMSLNSRGFRAFGLVGAGLGALQAPSGHRIEGAGRAALAGLGTNAGIGVGGAIGSALPEQHRALGTVLGMLGGGVAGYGLSNRLMGRPSWEASRPLPPGPDEHSGDTQDPETERAGVDKAAAYKSPGLKVPSKVPSMGTHVAPHEPAPAAGLGYDKPRRPRFAYERPEAGESTPRDPRPAGPGGFAGLKGAPALR